MYTEDWIEPPLDLIKCVTTEDTTRDGLGHPDHNLQLKRTCLPIEETSLTSLHAHQVCWYVLEYACPTVQLASTKTYASVPTP